MKVIQSSFIHSVLAKDHLHLDGGLHGILPDGVYKRGIPLEDLAERRRLGHPSRSRPLLLHARVLGHHPQFPHPVSLH